MQWAYSDLGASISSLPTVFPGSLPCHPGQDGLPLRHPRCLTTALCILYPCTPPKTSAHVNKALLPTALPTSSWCGKLALWPRLQTVKNSQCLGCYEPSAPDHMALVLRVPGCCVLKIFKEEKSIRASMPQSGGWTKVGISR